MKIKIKRIDKELPLPAYQTSGSVGFDLYAREEMLIASKEIKKIPANFIIEIPKNYMLMIASRSSTPIKKGLLIPNGVGIIDNDYCGPEDELKIQVYNFTEQPVTVTKGERIAQGIFVRVDKGEWEEVEEVTSETRGCFGSTGS
jgi:dUTP pyrophosphatase